MLPIAPAGLSPSPDRPHRHLARRSLACIPSRNSDAGGDLLPRSTKPAVTMCTDVGNGNVTSHCGRRFHITLIDDAKSSWLCKSLHTMLRQPLRVVLHGTKPQVDGNVYLEWLAGSTNSSLPDGTSFEITRVSGTASCLPEAHMFGLS